MLMRDYTLLTLTVLRLYILLPRYFSEMLSPVLTKFHFVFGILADVLASARIWRKGVSRDNSVLGLFRSDVFPFR